MRANQVRYLLFRYQKTSDLLKKYRSFCYVFDSFSLLFPFLAQEQIAPIALHYRHSFLKSGGSDSLSWLFTKEWPWAIHSQRSFAHKNKRILHCTFYVWDFCLIPKRRGQQFPIYWLAQEKMNILDIFLSFAILSLDLEIVHTLHRRKVNKEAKAKVVAAAWGLI